MALQDDVVQSLYAISLSLSAEAHRERPDYEAAFNYARAAIDDVIRDIRGCDLRANDSADDTLAGGLRLLAQDLRACGLATVDLAVDDNAAADLSAEATTELLQIAREAASNVARHAGATAVGLRLEHAADLLSLSIRDNGRGFDPLGHAMRRGDGIANMQSRARAIGGATHIISSERKGTLVRVELPVAEISPRPQPGQPARVLVVDGSQLVRRGLIRTLREAPGLVVAGEAASVQEALERARELKPDLVLMDIRLSDGSGIDACRLIRSERPLTRVVMLTSFADDEAVLNSVLAGASGYLLKQDDASQLISSLQRVAAGESLLSPDSVNSAMKLVRRPEPEAEDDPFLRLTPQEGKVLRLVAEGKTNREIARILGISEHTVRTYLSNIFTKLHIARRAEAAALAARSGPREPVASLQEAASRR
ncbi:MAG TPA: response regulator [Chloroflexota bacterium]|nr:response regulator [Chloroflexota bacterium]